MSNALRKYVHCHEFLIFLWVVAKQNFSWWLRSSKKLRQMAVWGAYPMAMPDWTDSGRILSACNVSRTVNTVKKKENIRHRKTWSKRHVLFSYPWYWARIGFHIVIKKFYWTKTETVTHLRVKVGRNAVFISISENY